MTPATAAPTTTTGTPAPPPLPMVRWDHLLLAMDVVAYLAQEPDQRGFSPHAVSRIVRERLGWHPRRWEARDLFEQFFPALGGLWRHRSPEGAEDSYNVAPLLDYLRERAARHRVFANPDGFERLLRAIVTGEVTEAELCGSESVPTLCLLRLERRGSGSRHEVVGRTRNDGGN